MSSWDSMRCSGCWRRCRYGRFTLHALRSFKEAQEMLRVESQDPRDWRYKRRHTILGVLHQDKLQAWEYATQHCPLAGQSGPVKPFNRGEAARWIRHAFDGNVVYTGVGRLELKCTMGGPPYAVTIEFLGSSIVSTGSWTRKGLARKLSTALNKWRRERLAEGLCS